MPMVLLKEEILHPWHVWVPVNNGDWIYHINWWSPDFERTIFPVGRTTIQVPAANVKPDRFDSAGALRLRSKHQTLRSGGGETE